MAFNMRLDNLSCNRYKYCFNFVENLVDCYLKEKNHQLRVINSNSKSTDCRSLVSGGGNSLRKNNSIKFNLQYLILSKILYFK